MKHSDDFVLFDKGTCVKESAVHGLGLFATRDIRAGMPIMVELAFISKKSEGHTGLHGSHFQLMAAAYGARTNPDLFTSEPITALVPRFDTPMAMIDFLYSKNASISGFLFGDDLKFSAYLEALFSKLEANKFFLSTPEKEMSDHYFANLEFGANVGAVALGLQPLFSLRNKTQGVAVARHYTEIYKKELKTNGGYNVLVFRASAINHASALRENTLLNASYTIDTHGTPRGMARFIVYAIRDIHLGDEIFINYGSEYEWESVAPQKSSTEPVKTDFAGHYYCPQVIKSVRQLEHMLPKKDRVHERANFMLEKAAYFKTLVYDGTKCGDMDKYAIDPLLQEIAIECMR